MCICRLLGLAPKFVTWTSEAAEAGVASGTTMATSNKMAPRQLRITPLTFMRSPLICRNISSIDRNVLEHKALAGSHLTSDLRTPYGQKTALLFRNFRR